MPWSMSLIPASLRTLTLSMCVALAAGGCGTAEAPNASALASCSTQADCAIFDDGDACTGVWACAAGKCALDASTKVVCDDSGDSLCAHNTCAPTTGVCALRARNLGAACEDGDPCTVGDACAAGACKPGAANRCACSTDADCDAEEDGDLCNGTLFCDVGTFPYRCAVKVSSVVTCPGGGPCQVAACDPETGSCSKTPRPDQTPCDDGDTCTKTDRCLKGTCVGGDNGCTCATDDDCTGQEDGDLCNGTLYCDKVKGSCAVNPSTVVTCPTFDNTDCSARVCQPLTGLCAMTAVNQGQACEDGDSCTIAQTCQGGLCAGGKDACKCVKDSDCAKAEDGNACNGTLFCNQQNGVCAVNPTTLVTCPSGKDTACSVNACALDTGACAPTPTELTKKVCASAVDNAPPACRIEQLPKTAPTPTVLCDDGDPCTVSDLCAKGVCTAGTQVCVCKTDADCAKQDDGDLCNGVMFCDKAVGKCKDNPATVITCPTVDDTACLKRTCEPKTGKCPLKAQKNGEICEDGDTCTKGDVCVFGQCNPGANTCECQTNADCLSKDDGDLCNGVPYCDKTNPKKPVCKENKASVVFCAPSVTTCATQVCNPASGACQPKPAADGKACDDGTVCTKASACKDGACVATATLDCDDNDACTLDTCDAKTGCAHLQSNCKDGNSCTDDACDAKTGACSFPARAKGAPCDADQSGCTIGDSCDASKCVAGPLVVCALPTKSCEQAVCQGKGADGYQCVVAAKADGAPCDDGDACSISSACAKGVCVATSGKDSLFARTYVPKGYAKGSLQAIARVGDGDYLLGGAAWSKSSDLRSWLLRVRADGEVDWQLTQTAKDGQGSGAIVGVLPVSTVAAAVLRNQPIIGGLVSGFLDVVPLTGTKVQLTVPIKPSKGVVEVSGGVVLPDGSYLLGGTRTSAKGERGWGTRLSSIGQPMWAADASDQTARVHGVGAPLGGLVLVGEAGPATQTRAWTAMLTPSGKLAWQLTLPGANGDRLNGITRAPGGGLLLVGTRKSTTKPRGFMLAVQEDGQVRWMRQAPSPSRSSAAVSLGDRGVRVVGRTIVTSKLHHGLLVGGDELGNPLFTRSVNGTPTADLRAIVAHDDNSIASVGDASSKTGAAEGLLWRVGAFGHETCKGQGKCVGKTLADCDDNKPCTANFCQAAAGCIYPPSSGFTCDPADGCHLDGVCASQVCKPTGRTRLFTREDGADAGVRTWTGAMPVAPSGWLLFGQDASLNSAIERIDATGTTLWSTVYTDMEKPTTGVATTIGGAVATADGGLILGLTRRPKEKSGTVASLRRIDAAGQVNAAFGNAAKWITDVGIAADLVAVPNTSDVVLIAQKAGSIAVSRVSAMGKKVWSSYTSYTNQFSRRVATDTRTSALGMADGGAIVGATLAPNSSADTGPWRPHLHRINGNGATIWHRDVVGIGAAKLTRVVRREGGAMLAVGWIPTPAQDSARLWLARFDDAGEVLWQRDHGLNLAPSGVAATPDGGLVVLGTQTTASKTSAMLLAKVGPGGGVWWQRTLGVAGASTQAGASTSVAVTASGGILAVGRSLIGAQPSRPVVMRVDPWGHATCAEAGTCGKQVGNAKTDSCDDKKPCTVDRCDPKTGACSHLAAHDGLACGDAKVCLAGTCTAEPEGFIWVPKGTFYMGCNPGNETCGSEESPLRKLSMKGFWMQRGEVTSGQLKACADQGKCKVPYKYSAKTAHLPASNVTWLAAEAYCAFLGARLPSEAEWAYAAKGSCELIDGDCLKGMPTRYQPPTMSACSWAKSTPAWSYAYGCGNKSLHAVGEASGDRSPWGVLDLMGNLREYTQDYYSPNAYKLDYSAFPFGPKQTPTPNNRVQRGGYYTLGTLDAQYRLAARHNGKVSGDFYVGFRCVKQ